MRKRWRICIAERELAMWRHTRKYIFQNEFSFFSSGHYSSISIGWSVYPDSFQPGHREGPATVINALPCRHGGRMSLGGLLPLRGTPPWYFTNVTRQRRDWSWSLRCSQRVMSLPGMIQPASDSATAVRDHASGGGAYCSCTYKWLQLCYANSGSGDISESPPPAVIANPRRPPLAYLALQTVPRDDSFSWRNLTLASHLNTLQAVSPLPPSTNKAARVIHLFSPRSQSLQLGWFVYQYVFSPRPQSSERERERFSI